MIRLTDSSLPDPSWLVERRTDLRTVPMHRFGPTLFKGYFNMMAEAAKNRWDGRLPSEVSEEEEVDS